MRKYMSAIIGAVLFSTGAMAQQGSLIQQSGSRLDAATGVAYATAAQGAQATATIPAQAGLNIYVSGISADTCANGTGGTAISNGNYTTTNLQSTPSLPLSFAGTANTCATPIREVYATPLKSLVVGTPVTVVSPAGSAQNIFAIRAFYYYAP